MLLLQKHLIPEREASRWLNGDPEARRPPELLTRDVVAKAIRGEQIAGRGSPHGGAFLDIASQRDAEYIKKKLPSMYHQFMKLGNLDITSTPMEVGPTCHYVMGGVRVEPETTMTQSKVFCGRRSSRWSSWCKQTWRKFLQISLFGARAGFHSAEYSKKIAEKLILPRIS